MNVSPLDLRQQRFRKAFRGFDTIEVNSLLLAVADDYEEALRETDRLRQDLLHMEGVLNEHRASEKSLKAVLLTAQRMADDLTVRAEEEAQRIIREAQSRSDLLLEKARGRLEDVQRDVDGLKLKREHVEASIEDIIGTLRHTLNSVREQEARGNDDNLLLHRRRQAGILEGESIATQEGEATAPQEDRRIASS